MTRDIPALTGVRAAAAFWVLLYHLRDELVPFFPPLAAIAGILDVGYLGVDVFFALSGFILTLNYADQFAEVGSAAYLRFLRKRLARIYPVHLFTLSLLVAAFALGLSVSANPRSHDRLDLLLNLLLVHDWVEHFSWNFVSWSISAEWFAYLVFPFLLAQVRRVRSAVACWAAVALSLLAMELAFVLLLPGTGGTSARGGLIRVTGEFTAGCFLAQIYRLAPPPERTARIAAPALIALALGWALWGGKSPWMAVLFPPLVLALASSGKGLSSLFGSRAFVYGGRISYALYMTHAILISRFGALFPSARWAGAPFASRAGLIALESGAIWLAADLTFRLVEEPCRRWLSIERVALRAGV